MAQFANAASLFFTSAEHRKRWLAAMLQIGKVYSGRLDAEYGAALYILTADEYTWMQAQAYVDCDGIDFEARLACSPFERRLWRPDQAGRESVQ